MTIQEKVQWAKEQWNLTNTIVIYERSNKAVYHSESDQWGAVVLKVNSDADELASEYNMLNEMSGKNSCRVFAYDAERGVLIEERIIPGIVLRNEKNAAVRVNHFLRVFREIHKTIDHVQNRATYFDWLERADAFCRDHDLDESITKKMHQARCIGEELFSKYDERVLLHGDLHHDNILLNDKGTYCMIDPKGVIGPKIFDLPRYILNEIDFVPDNECKNHVVQIVEMINKEIDYPFADIMKLFFMEVILANVWCIEDGEEPNLHQILIATQLFNEF